MRWATVGCGSVARPVNMYFKRRRHSIPEVTPETRLVIIENMFSLKVFKVPSKLDLHEFKWETRKAHLYVFEVLHWDLKCCYMNCCCMKSKFPACSVRSTVLLLSLWIPWGSTMEHCQSLAGPSCSHLGLTLLLAVPTPSLLPTPTDLMLYELFAAMPGRALCYLLCLSQNHRKVWVGMDLK